MFLFEVFWLPYKDPHGGERENQGTFENYRCQECPQVLLEALTLAWVEEMGAGLVRGGEREPFRMEAQLIFEIKTHQKHMAVYWGWETLFNLFYFNLRGRKRRDSGLSERHSGSSSWITEHEIQYFHSPNGSCFHIKMCRDVKWNLYFSLSSWVIKWKNLVYFK